MQGQQQQQQQQPDHDFPQFDVISGRIPIHSYILKPPNASTTSKKRIMQEWKLLGKQLQQMSIYVRVYEARVDLLRAAIVGAQGTPYHDGLFFFDFYFPPDYPNRPPMGTYRSFGYRVNPNLYANGTICLSLLSTWTGKATEKWNPNTSNILQVLLSLQALVLNAKPFFNEPSYKIFAGKSNWAEKKSLSYNRNVFILNCRSMLALLHRPPTNFEPLVKAHFKTRGASILAACDAYRKGLARIGEFDESSTVQIGTLKVSKKFKQAMDIIYESLVKKLYEIGASSLELFVVQLSEEAAAKEALEKVEMEKRKEKEKLKAANGVNIVKKLKEALPFGFWFKDKQSKTRAISHIPAH